jgi:hypothetical protein
MISLGHNLFGDSEDKYCPVDESLGDIRLWGSGLDISDVIEGLSWAHSPIWPSHGTLLHRLAPGSPAIDSGDPTDCPTHDQRFGVRPADGDGDGLFICDIGAHEYNPSDP